MAISHARATLDVGPGLHNGCVAFAVDVLL
jgi:hypothetical protein